MQEKVNELRCFHSPLLQQQDSAINKINPLWITSTSFFFSRILGCLLQRISSISRYLVNCINISIIHYNFRSFCSNLNLSFSRLKIYAHDTARAHCPCVYTVSVCFTDFHHPDPNLHRTYTFVFLCPPRSMAPPKSYPCPPIHPFWWKLRADIQKRKQHIDIYPTYRFTTHDWDPRISHPLKYVPSNMFPMQCCSVLSTHTRIRKAPKCERNVHLRVDMPVWKRMRSSLKLLRSTFRWWKACKAFREVWLSRNLKSLVSISSWVSLTVSDVRTFVQSISGKNLVLNL